MVVCIDRCRQSLKKTSVFFCRKSQELCHAILDGETKYMYNIPRSKQGKKDQTKRKNEPSHQTKYSWPKGQKRLTTQSLDKKQIYVRQ